MLTCEVLRFIPIIRSAGPQPRLHQPPPENVQALPRDAITASHSQDLPAPFDDSAPSKPGALDALKASGRWPPDNDVNDHRLPFRKMFAHPFRLCKGRCRGTAINRMMARTYSAIQAGALADEPFLPEPKKELPPKMEVDQSP